MLQRRLWIVGAAMLLSGAVVVNTLVAADGWSHRAALKRDLTRLDKENAQASTHAEDLRRSIHALRTRRDVQEHVIRDELGYVGLHEMVVKISDP